MCGICGIVDFMDRPEAPRQVLLRGMCDTLQHRGPDDKGIFNTDWVGLGHRRLSIVDLSSTGHQPMVSEEGEFAVAMNGEIYNHLELRELLIQRGYSYKGSSDTETVLNGYLEWGDALFPKLNGIFSLAIYNRKEGKVLLARDRFGVKPLYYTLKEDQLIFSSEIKGILSAQRVSPRIDYQGLHEFLYYGYALGDRTLFKGVYKLMPGQTFRIRRDGSIEKSYFWKPERDIELRKNTKERAAVLQVRTLLEQAVRRQLMSDVPVGVFLSGGIDSSAITAFASKHYGSKLKTYSAGFDFDGGHNELPLAKKIAARYHTEHHELMIKGEDMPTIIEKMVRHHDEPFSDAANIPLYLLTGEVRDACTVILQGDGGDELFGGYPRYPITHNYHFYKMGLYVAGKVSDWIPISKIRQKVDRFGSVFREREEGKFFAKLLTIESEEKSPSAVLRTPYRKKVLETNPFSYYQEVTARMDGLGSKTQKLLWLDTQIILPFQFLEKVDKSTMANGVEVRVPFLDNILAEYAMGLPAHLKVKRGVKKYLLKKALEDIVPRNVLYGPKKGFGVPYENWLKGPLFEYMKSRIYSTYIQSLGLLDYGYIDQLVEEHRSSIRNHGFILWKLMNLSIWLEEYKAQL